MKLLKSKYFILAGILFLAAGLAEGIVYMHYGELQARPVLLGQFMRIYPVYNDNGSWLHGRLGIGYVWWMLICEDILSLLLEVFLVRFISALCDFFSLSRKIILLMACGMSATAYRLFTRLRGVYVLDYLHVRGHGVFDLPDLYLFVMMVGIILWLLPYHMVYHPYKKEKVKGMSVLQKWAWELKFSGVFFRAVFLPQDRWEELFKEWK